ncbi:histidine kinase [Streptomyces sp. NPDC001941]|uniref:sensor histidine kinase n=1 Tax=Streptomyces sp. NPDC001941 TaxID=3154659 RepID=UPI00332950EE
MTGGLTALGALLRGFDRRHPAVWDLLLTSFWLVAVLIDATGGGWRSTAFDQGAPGWLVVLVAAGFAAPLPWRRTHPYRVLAAMLPFSLLNAWSGAYLQAGYLVWIAFFHVVLRRPPRTLLAALPLIALPLLVGVVRYPAEAWSRQILPELDGLLLVALLALGVRMRRESTASLEERAHRLEVERDQQAQLAAAAERARIAREMHDIIGHNLSVITGLADGGRYAAAKSPERAAQALDAIGTTSRQALADLRRLLGVLREDEEGAARAPQPTLDDLDDLVDGVRTAGLPVRLVRRGPASPLSPGRQLTVYRVVQEALTNTLKHAGTDARAEVTLAYGEKTLTATVTDTGTPTHGTGPGGMGSPGQGLTGMRERAALFDGTLDAGPRPDAGWRVALRIPLEDSLEDTPS